MYWANFLHIYQPPTQTEEITRKVTAESYRTLVRVLREAPAARVTLNISGCLTEQLARWGGGDVIGGLRELAEDGRIEFTGSAMHHPILPLIPPQEMARQIELNEETNRRRFGPAYAPAGFFPPEMCYSAAVGEAVRRMGFRWVIMDELGYNGRIGAAQTDRMYRDPAAGLLIFFRNRPLSASLTYGLFPDAARFLAATGERAQGNGYLLTGTDGEIYGHHRPGQERLLEEMYAAAPFPAVAVGDLIGLFPQVEDVPPVPSGWSTWEDELAAGAPFAKWTYPGNALQERQWELTHLAIALVEQARGTPGYPAARALLDAGLHSCQYWWASCRPWWDTGMIARGAALLGEAAALAAGGMPVHQAERARRLAEAVNDLARQWQESGHARALAESYRASHPFPFQSLSFAQPD